MATVTDETEAARYGTVRASAWSAESAADDGASATANGDGMGGSSSGGDGIGSGRSNKRRKYDNSGGGGGRPNGSPGRGGGGISGSVSYGLDCVVRSSGIAGLLFEGGDDGEGGREGGGVMLISDCGTHDDEGETGWSEAVHSSTTRCDGAGNVRCVPAGVASRGNSIN